MLSYSFIALFSIALAANIVARNEKIRANRHYNNLAGREDEGNVTCPHNYVGNICNQDEWAIAGVQMDPMYLCMEGNASDPTGQLTMLINYIRLNHMTDSSNVWCPNPTLRALVQSAAAGSFASAQAMADNLLLTVNRPGMLYVATIGDVACGYRGPMADDNGCVYNTTNAAMNKFVSVGAYKVMP